VASTKRRIERSVIRRAQPLKEFHEVFEACNAKGNKIAYLWVIVGVLLVEYVCTISLSAAVIVRASVRE